MVITLAFTSQGREYLWCISDFRKCTLMNQGQGQLKVKLKFHVSFKKVMFQRPVFTKSAPSPHLFVN